MWRGVSVARSSSSSCPCPAAAVLDAQIASFHSSRVSLAKWKSKWDHKGEKSGQQPSKTYIRYAVRQKRAEIKKALKDHLLYGKSPRLLFQDANFSYCSDETGNRNFRVKNNSSGFGYTWSFRNAGRAKGHSFSDHGKGKYQKDKFWQDKEWFHDVDPETVFEAMYNRRGSFSFFFSSWENFSFKNSRTTYEPKDESRWGDTHSSAGSDSDSDEESIDIGSHSHRITLGLPPRGPLNLHDVKSAFHKSALKWHPDKHQGPSQAMAAEKFKVCLDAYNSLCSGLKAV